MLLTVAGTWTLLLSQIHYVMSIAGRGDDSPFSPLKLAESTVLMFLNQQLQDVFAGDMEASHYDDSGGSGSVKLNCPSDLNCDFSVSCKWRNVNESALHFFSGKGSPDPDVLAIVTGAEDVPGTSICTDYQTLEPPYVLAASQEVRNSAWFVSNPVPYQKGDGILKFKYWLTPVTELRVCTRHPNSVKLDWCSQAYKAKNNPSKATEIVKIPGPISNAFEIIIEMTHFVLATGGMGLIDDITYSASPTCDTDDSDGYDLSSTSETSSTGQLNGVSSVETANSDTSAEAPIVLPIRHHSATTKFRPTETQKPKETVQSISSTNSLQSSLKVTGAPSAVVTGAPAGDSTTTIGAGSGPGSVTTLLPQQTTTLSAPSVGNLCQILNCDFDKDNACNYRWDTLSLFRFQVQNYKDENSASASPGGYVVASGSMAAGMGSVPFVMESAPFVFSQPFEVQFLRFQKGARSRLSICVNNKNSCLSSFNEQTDDTWKQSAVTVSPSDAQVQPATLYFVVENIDSSEQFVAIDDIKLRSPCE